MCSGDAMAPMELRCAYGWIIVLSESAVIDSRKDYFAVRLVRSGIVDRAKIPSWVIAVFDLNWTASEKKIARRAFQTALDRELAALIEESKKRMNQVSTSEGLWEFEQWLSERRREIDKTYYFRYSILPTVFAKLLHRRTLSEVELAGLSSEKIELIQRFGIYHS